MSLILDGSNGLSDVDGTAATPAIRGTDTNTGIFFPAADTIAFSEGGTEAMRINGSGFVGIGTTNPIGNLQVSDPTASELVLEATNAGGRQYFIQTGDTASGLAGSLRFFDNTASAERMRIDSSGNLLVGVTAQRGSSIISTGANGVGIGSGTAAQGYRQIYFDQASGILYFTNGVNQAALTLAGAWTNASDGRLKNTVVDIPYGLNAVMAAQPRGYKMNDMEGNYIGFVAQELQEVIPEVVSGDPEMQLGVDYGSLVAVAFKAIQELKSELDTVKAELATLKAKS
jgi:hypothetical protein